jgi:hypothetical protein
MSLDIEKLYQQVSHFASTLKGEAQDYQQKLSQALKLYNQANWPALRHKIEAAKTSWLIAQPIEDGIFTLPPAPKDYTVLATDGSHIETDRHQSISLALINIGRVLISYGQKPGATLESVPELFKKDQLIIHGEGQEQIIEGTLLGIKRTIAECSHLADMARNAPDDRPILALLDGSLILWGLVSMGYPDFVIREMLDNGFLRQLDSLEEISRAKRLALASYISMPGSTEVTNILRVALCPYDIPDCDHYCSRILSGQRPCDEVNGLLDRQLFLGLLAPGQRSPIFQSASSIVKKYYGHHRVNFFYLRLEDEIGRVEMPEWTAVNSNLLELTSSALYDQCLRGMGYPVALSEAHEKAVLGAEERREFESVLEYALEEEGIPILISAKKKSKIRRWI